MSLESEKRALQNKLQAAAQLELSTIPAYFTALKSIKPATQKGHSPKNLKSIEIIRSVMMEEMLHFTLAGNLLTSIGGALSLTSANIPSYPLNLDFEGVIYHRDFVVNLAAFSEDSITSFKEIELPTDLVDQNVGNENAAVVPAITIGSFYDSLLVDLEDMTVRHGEKAVFSGNPSWQISPTYYWGGGGEAVVVTSLESAREAIRVIVTQGEGSGASVSDGDRKYFEQRQEVAHYFRFNEIFHNQYYKMSDDPKKDPTGAPFVVDYSDVYSILPNPKSADYESDKEANEINNAFNYAYTLMLKQIVQGFNGMPQILLAAIAEGMHDMSKLAAAMMLLDVTKGNETYKAAPSFEWNESKK